MLSLAPSCGLLLAYLAYNPPSLVFSNATGAPVVAVASYRTDDSATASIALQTFDAATGTPLQSYVTLWQSSSLPDPSYVRVVAYAGGFIMAGQMESAPWVAATDGRGAVYWNVTLPGSRPSSVLDHLVTPDSVLLVSWEDYPRHLLTVWSIALTDGTAVSKQIPNDVCYSFLTTASLAQHDGSNAPFRLILGGQCALDVPRGPDGILNASKAWIVDIPDVGPNAFPALVDADNTLYLVDFDDVYALNVSNGALIGMQTFPGMYFSTRSFTPLGSGALAYVAVTDGEGGACYAEFESCVFIWSRTPLPPPPSPLPQPPWYTQPGPQAGLAIGGIALVLLEVGVLLHYLRLRQRRSGYSQLAAGQV